MYQPRTIGDDVEPYATALAQRARDGRLVIHAGSGLSVAEPAALKAGPDLAEAVCSGLEALIGQLPDFDRTDLAAAADALTIVPNGLDALKQAILSSNEYLTAEPNYGHCILALLVQERAVKVLTTNWDNCIERGAIPEIVQSVILDVHLTQVGNPILKLHGCATLVDSMRITSNEMSNPPPWAVNEAKARLAGSDVVFVGTGSPSPYVKDGIEELLGAPHHNITLVSPNLSTDWDLSRWSEILPDLDEQRRLGISADEFLDNLACAYIKLSMQQVSALVDESEAKVQALQRVANALDTLSALFVLRWLRGASVPKGEPAVVFSQFTALALVAIGLLGPDPQFRAPSEVRVDGIDYSVIVGTGTSPPARLRAEAVRRLERFRSNGGSPEDSPSFLVSSAIDVTQSTGPVPDVLGTSTYDDLVGGPVSGSPCLIDARKTVDHG